MKALLRWSAIYVSTGVLEEIATFLVRIVNSYILKKDAAHFSINSAPTWKSRMSQNFFHLIIVSNQHNTVIQMIPFCYWI